MAKHKKPRCFVAMAFDHEDTDALYTKAIEPVLRRNDVIPVILDRRQKNTDINVQLIDQLNRADFCIADLTYARPSVYFEAGYAQREAEVIYTVREDHLRKSQPEDRRVHFDLQMKPLVKWKGPDDKSFQVELEKRLRQTALRKWRVEQRATEKMAKDRAAFAALPEDEKLRCIRSLAIHALHRRGFSEWFRQLPTESVLHGAMRERIRADMDKLYRNPARFARQDYVFVGRRKLNRKLVVTSVAAARSMTQKRLEQQVGSKILWSRHPAPLLTRYSLRDRSKTKETEEHHIIISLNEVPRSRIMSVLPSVSFEPESGRYCGQASFKEASVQRGFVIPRTVYLYFLKRIESRDLFKARLATVIDYVPRVK